VQPVAKTATFSVLLGLLIAWNWGRLETNRSALQIGLMIVLGVAPALLPSLRLRLAGGGVALIAAWSIALQVPPYAVGKVLSRTGRGFLDFYDVLVPFDPSEHRLMNGVVLLAIFAFTALASLAVASRRPLLASLVLVAGAGWPATIFPGHDDLGRGALLLLAALALVARLGPTSRRGAPQALVATVLAVTALIASSWNGVAQAQFINWQTWDFSAHAGPSVSVEYVWNANYRGVNFPKKRTRVFTVKTDDSRGTYWRATTLDTFAHDAWREDRFPLGPFSVIRGDGRDALTTDSFLPERAANPILWRKATVHIDALRDNHLITGSGPVAYESHDGVQYSRGGVAVVSGKAPGRGTEYASWSWEPQPKPAALAKSPADYPADTRADGYLEVAPGRSVPSFRTQARQVWLVHAFDDPSLRPYLPLYRAAEDVAGTATNPYAATVAIEAWLRSSGGFSYNEHPPQISGMPPLVAFVTRTQQGYCQHFAGAMALMLRYLGIPSRVAAGFTSGVYDADKGTWRVNDRNAHTWVEVWFQGYGWLPFDPTPGRGNLGGSYTTSSISFDAPGADAVLRKSIGAPQARNLLRFQLGTPGQRLGGATRASSGDVAKARNGNSSANGFPVARAVVAALIALVLLLVLAKLVFQRSRFLTGDPRAIATACRRELVGYLLDVGITIPGNVGLDELGQVVLKRTGVDSGRLVEHMGLARFGPPAASEDAAREAKSELRAVRRRLRRAIPLGRRARGLFSVRSLLAS
jgi:transglutaminase-like putative cysteine protease